MKNDQDYKDLIPEEYRGLLEFTPVIDRGRVVSYFNGELMDDAYGISGDRMYEYAKTKVGTYLEALRTPLHNILEYSEGDRERDPIIRAIYEWRIQNG